MPVKLTADQKKEALSSIERFLNDELECEASSMQAGFLLEYFLKEIAPLAYNQGVEDARSFFQGKLEDLSGTCFEHAFTYWDSGKSRKR